MKLYKKVEEKVKECNCDKQQLEFMEAAGWTKNKSGVVEKAAEDDSNSEEKTEKTEKTESKTDDKDSSESNKIEATKTPAAASKTASK